MGATIKIANVCKDYGVTKVIDNINFQIEDHEFVTILGPSGAGKTTLLKMIAGFEDTTSGNIYINGDDILKKPIHKRNIGMLFQNYALFPHMTVNENIAFPLGLRHVPKNERKTCVDDILAKVKLTEYGKRYPRELSGGQQQRVALARALVFNPPILLLDEPMAALDKQLRKHMQIEIKKIHDEMGITTISVTHDQEEALTMATKVCIMRDGKVEQIASPVEIYERPNSVFVAKFIGEANIVECPVVKADKNSVTIEVYGDHKVTLKGNPNEYTVGNHVYLVIRPEKVKLVDDSYGQLKFKAKIEQIIYVGDVLKLKVRLENGMSMKVKVFTQYSVSMKLGEFITIGIGEEDMVLVNP